MIKRIGGNAMRMKISKALLDSKMNVIVAAFPSGDRFDHPSWTSMMIPTMKLANRKEASLSPWGSTLHSLPCPRDDRGEDF
jgi:hypothetical protein